MFSKEMLDFAMEKIITYYAKYPGRTIELGFLRYSGLPKDVDEDQLLQTLAAKGLITYQLELLQDEVKTIRLTKKGKCYFVDQAEAEDKEKRIEQRESRRQKEQFAHDWRIAIFSALAGAVLSKPIWAGIEWLIQIIRS